MGAKLVQLSVLISLCKEQKEVNITEKDYLLTLLVEMQDWSTKAPGALNEERLYSLVVSALSMEEQV